MKSAYNKPEMKVVAIKTIHVMAGSPGIGEGKGLGNAYTSTDVTYGRQDNSWDIWGNGDYSDED